jgi:transcriptional regulator with XRE-family HTH domain
MNEESKRLNQLGARLRYYRKLKGYTNYEHLAYDLGISRSQYGKYENGGNIKFSTLCKILSFLNVSLKEFFSDGFEEEKI